LRSYLFVGFFSLLLLVPIGVNGQYGKDGGYSLEEALDIQRKRIESAENCKSNIQIFTIFVNPLPDWANKHYFTMVDSAITNWEYTNSCLKIKKTYDSQNADIVISWVKDFGVDKLGHTTGKKFIEIGLGDSKCFDSWNGYSVSTVLSILMHEIGHSIGFDHSEDTDSIMYPTLMNIQYDRFNEQITLENKGFKVIPLCSYNLNPSFGISIKSLDENSRFNFITVPSMSDVKSWASSEEFLSVNYCESKDNNLLATTCIGIPKNSLMIIESSSEQLSSSYSISYEEQPAHYGTDLKNHDVNTHFPIFHNGELIMTSDFDGKFVMNTITNDEISPIPNSKVGGCLIATATFDSELAPQVQKLREIRDSKLLSTESGSQFMEHFNSFYYSFSPYIADYERENPLFKEIVKIGITPMLSTLSLMDYAETESEVLGIGISLIILNGMMYVGLPAFGIMILRKQAIQ
jgi:hypothetical protein